MRLSSPVEGPIGRLNAGGPSVSLVLPDNCHGRPFSLALDQDRLAEVLLRAGSESSRSLVLGWRPFGDFVPWVDPPKRLLALQEGGACQRGLYLWLWARGGVRRPLVALPYLHVYGWISSARVATSIAWLVPALPGGMQHALLIPVGARCQGLVPVLVPPEGAHLAQVHRRGPVRSPPVRVQVDGLVVGLVVL